MKKVSVVMASYLGNYPGRATNPEQKFMRAVKSFLTQTYENKELIIVSDGCDVTERLYDFNFKKFDNIEFVKIEKQPTYSGDCRNAGLEIATGDIVTYLDNDDVLGKKHLEIIMSQMKDDLDFVYYDDYLFEGTGQLGRSSLRKVEIETGKVLLKHDLERKFFGEGIVLFKDRIYQLTWKHNTGFVYNLESFTFIKNIHYFFV